MDVLRPILNVLLVFGNSHPEGEYFAIDFLALLIEGELLALNASLQLLHLNPTPFLLLQQLLHSLPLLYQFALHQSVLLLGERHLLHLAELVALLLADIIIGLAQLPLLFLQTALYLLGLRVGFSQSVPEGGVGRYQFYLLALNSLLELEYGDFLVLVGLHEFVGLVLVVEYLGLLLPHLLDLLLQLGLAGLQLGPQQVVESLVTVLDGL